MGVLLVLLGLGCRPSSDAAEPEPVVVDERAPANGWLTKPSEPDPVRERESEDETTVVREGSPCELACADVYACLLADGREPSAAATIELGCLDACVRAPAAFASCERPGSIDAQACTGYLECAHAAWPDGERSTTQIDPQADGCKLACVALARCNDATLDAAEECGRLCREALDDTHERLAGECAQLDGCTAIEECVFALPGATDS